MHIEVFTYSYSPIAPDLLWNKALNKSIIVLNKVRKEMKCCVANQNAIVISHVDKPPLNLCYCLTRQQLTHWGL